MPSFGFSLAESAISGAFKSVNPFVKDRESGGINWANYNYPPCFGIMHYDIDDIKNEELQGEVLKMHRVFLISLVTCILNLFDNVIDASFYTGPTWNWVIYSILNFFLIVPISLYIFYIGSRGLTAVDSSLLQRYSIMGVIQVIFLFLFTVMPFGAMNGLLSFAMYKVTWYWAVAVVVESALWATAFALCLSSVIYVIKKDYNGLPIASRTK